MPFYIGISILIMGSMHEIIQINKTNKKKWLSYTLIIYVIISYLILLDMKNSEQGKILLLILISNVWASDSGGYVVGSFGKYKFCKMSPKKTIEGLVGSFMFCLIINFFMRNLIYDYTNFHFLIISAIICTSSIIGDLIISKFKRVHGKKDSGRFLPEHGGFLDRLDSLFLATPIYYLLICI